MDLTDRMIDSLDSRTSVSKDQKQVGSPKDIYIQDPKFLCISSFDCHFDLLCAAKPTLNQIISSAGLLAEMNCGILI